MRCARARAEIVRWLPGKGQPAVPGLPHLLGRQTTIAPPRKSASPMRQRLVTPGSAPCAWERSPLRPRLPLPPQLLPLPRRLPLRLPRSRVRMLARPRHHHRRDQPLRHHRGSQIETGCGGSSALWRSPRCSGGSSSGRSRNRRRGDAGGDGCRSRRHDPRRGRGRRGAGRHRGDPGRGARHSRWEQRRVLPPLLPPRWGHRARRPPWQHLMRRRWPMQSRLRRRSSKTRPRRQRPRPRSGPCRVGHSTH